MEKQLIFEDTQKIQEYINRLEVIKPLFQNVVDNLENMEIDPVISDIYILVLTFRQNNMSEKQIQQYIENYLREKLVDKAENASIGGVKVSRDKLLEMVELPDCKVFVNAISVLKERSSGYVELNFNYYELIDTTVSIKESAQDEITELYRVYAITDKQIETYLIAKAVADKLNELESNCKHLLYKIDKTSISDSFSFLKLHNGSWCVDSHFIQSLL